MVLVSQRDITLREQYLLNDKIIAQTADDVMKWFSYFPIWDGWITDDLDGMKKVLRFLFVRRYEPIYLDWILITEPKTRSAIELAVKLSYLGYRVGYKTDFPSPLTKIIGDLKPRVIEREIKTIPELDHELDDFVPGRVERPVWKS